MVKYHEIVGYTLQHLGNTFCIKDAEDIAENNGFDLDEENDPNVQPIFYGDEQIEGDLLCGHCHKIIKECEHSSDKKNHVFSVEHIDTKTPRSFYMEVIAICKFCGRDNEDLAYTVELYKDLGKLSLAKRKKLGILF